MKYKTITKWFSLLLVLMVAGVTNTLAQSLTIDNFAIKKGETKEVFIKLDAGSETVYGVQTDLVLSEGLSIESAQSAVSGIDLGQNVVSSGATRFALLGLLSGNTIPAGEVIKLTVKASDTFESGTIQLTKNEVTISAGGNLVNPANATCTVTLETEPEWTWRDIKVTLADEDKWQALVASGATVLITVDPTDGSIGTTDNADIAAASLTGKWHSTNYGWSNFTATVRVAGCVKITYATHDYGNDIIVTNDAGDEVAKLNTQGAKWSSSHDNVAVAYYRTNTATTLHFSNAKYNPYFAVEAIDPSDLPPLVTKYNVTFAAGEGTGAAPAAVEVEAGQGIKAPKNYTLFAEGKTLTGWSDGTTTYAIGADITPTADVTLTAQYTANEVELADRTAAVTLTFPLDGNNDNPKYNFQGNTGIIVTQATVNGKSIDVKADVDATSGKFAHNGSGWHQVNTGTKVTVPSCKGATIAVTTHNDATSVKFNGGTDGVVTSGNTATYTATATDATALIEQVSNNYWNKLVVTLPAVGGDEPHDPVTLVWDYTEKTIPTTGPDEGLYYASYVNDAPTTNNGMNGVKLNSSGWAYFEKPDGVAGKLYLTMGLRKGSGAFAVNVYTGSMAAGATTPTKGDLIGEVAVAESPGTNSIDIDADVTGIYIERKTSSEGVLQKIVFKENVERTFQDFEIPYATLTKTGYTGADLPTGVTFSGEFHDNQHGYSNAIVVVPVDGTVKFTISGCKYANPQTFPVKNSDGETVATLDQVAAGCYDAGGTITYIYTGNPTTLTFGPISYLSYFKAEASEVQEVTITYKDQNGNVLGTKKVFEGDAIGEIPYTEADLTIPSGYKFRGWVYNSGVKVKATDIVNDNTTVKASVTAIEAEPTVGSVQTYDLTKPTFYPEDHENFDMNGGTYYNNHGFTIDAGGSFSVKVAGNAQVVLELCEYGNATTFTVTDAGGSTVASDVPAKAPSGEDGKTTTVNYSGTATTLTFTFAAQTYLHKVTVYNVKDIIEKDEASGYYIIPAGDAASLVMAINAANAETGAKIFLPNGTYDLGDAVLTGISGTNVSIIGESMEGVIIKNAPPVSMEGLGSADLFQNTGTGLYIQDLTLQNALDYKNAGSAGRAVTLHDKGTQTINKNVRHLSYQDTYYSHKPGGLYYFEGGEIHGVVDYVCGDGKVYFNGVTFVNEQRNTATIAANSELYVFNNCVIQNNADSYNFGRAWSNHPVCVWLNTTLEDPSHLLSTRWNLTGINCDFSIAGEYGTMDATGNDITPASNVVTFTKENTEMNTILDASALETYSIDNVLGSWATTAQSQATQVEAPTATLDNGVISWTASAGATAYALFKDGQFLTIVGGETTSYNVESSAPAANAPSLESSSSAYTIRAANERGGFGEAKAITDVTGIRTIDNGQLTIDNVIYDLNGRRVTNPSHGVYIVNGHKVVIK